MKIQRAAFVFAIIFMVGLTACDTVSNSTPTPPVLATALAASPTTAVAVAITPTAATAVVTPTVNATAAPTSTPVVLDLPTNTPAAAGATDTPSSATNVTPTAGSFSSPSSELIFYLASDGQTINTMKPDGSDAGKLVTKVDLQASDKITGMSASKDGKYLVYNLTLTAGTYDVTDYYLVANGNATRLTGIGKPPVWFTDYFVAAAQNSSNSSEPTEIFRVFPASINDPANFMIDTGVKGSLYTLTPDGTQLVYVDATGNIMGLGLSHMTEHQPYTLVNLNPSAKPGDANFFQVDWLNYAPDGTLVFAGGKKSDIGPFGDNAQVWTYTGGAAANQGTPTPINDHGRYDAYDFIGQTALVVNAAEHGGACGDIPHLKTLDFSSQAVAENKIPGDSLAGRYYVYGLSGAPLGDNHTSYVYGLQPYTCDSNNSPQFNGPSSIYVWSSANPTSTKIGDGQFPVWVDTNSKP